MHPWDLLFLVYDDFSLYVFRKFLLGDCCGWDCAFFWNGFVVHDAPQHYCAMYTRLCVQLGFRKLYEHNAYLRRIGWLTVSMVAGQFDKHSPRGEQVYILNRSVHAGL